ncbi:MAG: hypothetical protein AAB632_03465 [Patescibacteria group bacterium]
MKLRIFISGDAPEMRDAQELVDRIKETSDIEAETLDIGDREGKEIAEVYDITAVPSFLLTTDDGVVIGSWIGKVPAEFELKNVIYA